MCLKKNYFLQNIQKKDSLFYLYDRKKETPIIAEKVLVAPGGKADPRHYQWLHDLGHSIVPPIPSLFTFHIEDQELHKLQGISVTARIQAFSTEVEGPLLITHQGFSGPSVLKMSALKAREAFASNYQFPIRINWTLGTLPQILEALQEWKVREGKKMVPSHPLFGLPKRLWQYLSQGLNKKWGEITKKELLDLSKRLVASEFEVIGKSMFKEEFVTAGGVSLKEVDFRRMESKIIPSLFFAGEVLDIDGLTGGFNFQAAWSTAWAASQAIFSEER
ncbi:MAG: aminoacetone oxidase family FAD-binding enzyme [Planctomycetota bacterium]|nr:MAG: aminoacetone oxidase family FAD-binding enzyme [Planctomycetota bacterium]